MQSYQRLTKVGLLDGFLVVLLRVSKNVLLQLSSSDSFLFGFSEMSSDQLKSFISGAPEGSMRLAGEKELARREISKQSLAASELFRRGRIEGLF